MLARKHVFKTLILFFFLLCIVDASAQLTTASIGGQVTDNQRKPMSGAMVTVEFPEAGIKQVVKTTANGSYELNNLRVGGPYKVTVDMNGKQNVVENIYLQLGKPANVDVLIEEKETTLDNVVVEGRRSKIFDARRTGALTNVDAKQLIEMPSISRSADDFTRFTPSASSTYNGMSFAGRNGQYNNLSLDGAIFNNPFGLDAPGPGGTAGAQPISIDAIEQIQVSIAPYDVTQSGFTGAGVNTVTKSGTNTTKGVAYVYYRNDAMTGKKIEGNTIQVPELSQVQAGFSLGGAIKKNKLFYFVNFETEQRQDAGTNYKPRASESDPITGNTSRVLESDLIAVKRVLSDSFGYDAGAYKDFSFKQINYKWLAKLTWNINQNNRLDFTYNGLTALKDKPAHPSAIGSRGPDALTLQFQNSAYTIHTNVHSFNLELNSSKPGVFSNKLKLVHTRFDEYRIPFSAPAPVINLTKNGANYIIAGHEPFSIHNSLSQAVTQVINNFNYYLNKHTLTGGVSLEIFNFENKFNLTGYGFQVFGSMDVEDFKSHPSLNNNITGSPTFRKADFDYAKQQDALNQWPITDLNVGQFSAYVQDVWKASNRFSLTYGLRLDLPIYFSSSFTTYNNGVATVNSPTIANNDNMKLFDENGKVITNGQGKDLDNTKLPASTPLFSPRVGFNWDVTGRKVIQVRGGSGFFTGRFPFVWIANQLQNPYTGYYNVTAQDFKWPQVWRTNIGIDWKLPSQTTFVLDVLYTKDINGMMVRNYNLGTPTAALSSNTGDNRAVYDTTASKDRSPGNTYVFTNTDVGQSFNISFQVQQVVWKNLFLMLGYNYLYATDASSISAEISGDAFDRNPILNNANRATDTRSLYGNTHRFIFSANKRFAYGKQEADYKPSTTVSIFANATSGRRFAYVYGGDANNDGSGLNDLLYVPTDAEIDKMTFSEFKDVFGSNVTVEQQKVAMKAFIQQDDYLSGRRGQYAEKYASENPWFSQVDIRILQEFPIRVGGKRNSIQITLDIINVGNLLSSEWGLQKIASNASYFQPWKTSLSRNASTGVYESSYSFDPSLKKTFNVDADLVSRWQMQLGVRYTF